MWGVWSSLSGHIGPPIMLDIEPKMVSIIWARRLINFKYMPFVAVCSYIHILSRTTQMWVSRLLQCSILACLPYIWWSWGTRSSRRLDAESASRSFLKKPFLNPKRPWTMSSRGPESEQRVMLSQCSYIYSFRVYIFSVRSITEYCCCCLPDTDGCNFILLFLCFIVARPEKGWILSGINVEWIS